MYACILTQQQELPLGKTNPELGISTIIVTNHFAEAQACPRGKKLYLQKGWLLLTPSLPFWSPR